MAIGPVIGGVLAGTLGFRYIFWLLTLLGGIAFISLFVLLPETLRTLAGNGSTPLRGWKYEPLLSALTPWGKAAALEIEAEEKPEKEKLTASMFVRPLLFLLEPDVACTLFFGAVIYTVFSMVGTFVGVSYKLNIVSMLIKYFLIQVSASTSFLLAREYHLSTIQYVTCPATICPSKG